MSEEKRPQTIRSTKRKYRLPGNTSMLFEAAVLQMIRFLNLTLGIVVVCILASCAQQPVVQPRTTSTVPQLNPGRISNVRTTAYTRTESGGRHNALGARLSVRQVMSAASDWSVFPL